KETNQRLSEKIRIMMEKDLNKQELDQLIHDWTDELLAPDIDKHITGSLMKFVENDDTEIDAEKLIDLHIHQLAMEENIAKRRKWKILVNSAAAAAAVVIFIVAAIFFTTHEHGIRSNTNLLVAENQDENITIRDKSELPVTSVDSCKMILAKTEIKGKSEVESKPTNKRKLAEKANKQKESTSELNLIEAIAEINAGLDNMVEITMESMNIANVSLLPVNLFSNSNESNNIEFTSNEYSSSQDSEQMQKLNIIENNLINALYEIRNLNIDLNFETDNKTTEI
ncbi:MAG: hypothetical protein K2K23_04980, partial [Muribaculaceae bacterium]|nr:hypothetical protein [Muribaculaceae bacterium]